MIFILQFLTCLQLEPSQVYRMLASAPLVCFAGVELAHAPFFPFLSSQIRPSTYHALLFGSDPHSIFGSIELGGCGIQ